MGAENTGFYSYCETKIIKGNGRRTNLISLSECLDQIQQPKLKMPHIHFMPFIEQYRTELNKFNACRNANFDTVYAL